MFGAAVLHEVGFGVELLAVDAVPPLVVTPIEIAGGRAALPEPFDCGTVTCVDACPDEVVEADAQHRGKLGEPACVLGNEVMNRNAGELGREHVLQRVLVGTSKKADFIAPGAPRPRQHVGSHKFERVTKMRAGVDIGNRNGEIGTSHRNPPAPLGPRSPMDSGGPNQEASTRSVRRRVPLRAPVGAHHHEERDQCRHATIVASDRCRSRGHRFCWALPPQRRHSGAPTWVDLRSAAAGTGEGLNGRRNAER